MSKYSYNSGWLNGEHEAKCTLRFDCAAWDRDVQRLREIEREKEVIKSNISSYRFFISGNLWLDQKIHYNFKPVVEEQLDVLNREWANKGWEDSYAHRYPMGKGAIPEYSYWEHERMGYIEARKRIYIPLYSEAVLKTESFKQLKEMYENEQDIILFDYDGYSDYSDLNEVINNPKRKMGHGFVLEMLLKGHY